MKFIYLLSLGVFFFCIGCVSRPATDGTLFLEKQKLTGQVLLTDEVLLSPNKLLITDSLLIICNRNDSLFLEAFCLSTCENLGRFLSKGNGPEDFIYLGTMQRGEDNRSFYVSDFKSHKLFRYDEEDIIKGRITPIPVNLPDRNIEGAQFTYYWVSSKGIIAQNITDKGRICLFMPDTLLFWGDYPSADKVDKRLTDYPLANTMLYQSSVTLSPSGNKIALVCDLADMLDIYFLQTDGITTEWSYWRAFPDEMVVMPNGDQYMAGASMRTTCHYIDVCSSDRYIYALYSGEKMGQPRYMTASRIRVVSWDGTWSKELETTDQLRAISLSPDGNTLYGINQTEEGYEIKTYDLTTIF